MTNSNLTVEVSPHNIQESAKEVRTAFQSEDQNLGLVLQVLLYDGWYVPGRLVDQNRFAVEATIPLSSADETALQAGFQAAREALGKKSYGRPIKYQVEMAAQPPQR